MTTDNSSVPLTRAAYDELQQELERLRTEGRREVAEEIRTARDTELDQDEDVIPAFEAAKEGQAFLEGRILQIERALANAVIIDEEAVRTSETVQIGSTVVVQHNGGERTYRIVSSIEADAASGRISDDSPIGAALLGKRRGDTVEVDVPAGRQRFTINELG
jgi:transcription elongation factor GreA